MIEISIRGRKRAVRSFPVGETTIIVKGLVLKTCFLKKA